MPTRPHWCGCSNDGPCMQCEMLGVNRGDKPRTTSLENQMRTVEEILGFILEEEIHLKNHNNRIHQGKGSTYIDAQEDILEKIKSFILGGDGE